MADDIALQTLSFRDAKGHLGRTSYRYAFDPTVAANTHNALVAVQAINAAIAALSNGVLVSVGGLASREYNPNSYGATSTYQNAEDKAVLTYQYAASSGPVVYGLTKISIPSPILALFLADGETVDGANVALGTLTTALKALDASNGFPAVKAGYPYINFVGGVFIRRKQQRKLGLWTLDPSEMEREE